MDFSINYFTHITLVITAAAIFYDHINRYYESRMRIDQILQ